LAALLHHQSRRTVSFRPEGTLHAETGVFETLAIGLKSIQKGIGASQVTASFTSTNGSPGAEVLQLMTVTWQVFWSILTTQFCGIVPGGG